MSNGEFNNKVMGAVIATGLAIVGLNTISGSVFHPHQPEKLGYSIAIDTGPADGGAKAAEGPIDWGTLLQDASLVAKGEGVAKKCLACHVFEKGGANKAGPALFGVMGRMSGVHEGFAYSDAMKAHAKPWDYEELNHFLTSPAGYIKGTKMGFAGIKKTEDRVALIAYLRSMSDSPMPMPAPLPVVTTPTAADGAEAAAPAADAAAAPIAPAAAPASAPAAPPAA